MGTILCNTGLIYLEHFNQHEFECPCCKYVEMDISLMSYLDTLRERLNSPIIVNSAFRCEKHNKVVGGSPDSQHLLGKAIDITSKLFSPYLIYLVASSIKDEGFRGFIIYDTFVHLDVRSSEKYFADKRL